ncbi:MAG: alpha/beta hydrolase [Bacilli bacterium]
MNIIDNFDMVNNYKLYRRIQKIFNPAIGTKKRYQDTYLEVENRKIPIRIFNPTDAKKIIIYMHGGGWISGDIETHTNICFRLAKYTNRKVVSIDYRLAPENPFPAGFDDCYIVVKSIMHNVKSLDITWEDVTLMGDSAGGNLVAAVTTKARENHDFRVKSQILLYPSVQSDYSKTTKYKSISENSNKGFLTQKQLNDFLKHYIKNESDYKNVYVAPFYAKKLYGLPKTLIITGTKDPLVDEGRAYYKKLKRHLVPVEYHELDGAIHGFFSNILEKKYTEETLVIIKKFLGDKDE